MTHLIHLDFETYSAANLTTVGAANYAEHPTTDYHVLCFCIDDGPIRRIYNRDNGLESDNAQLFLDAINEGDSVFVAHNAIFEQYIYHHRIEKIYGWPAILEERWKCTMAKAAAHSLPQNLEQAAKAMKLKAEKDMEGAAIMKKLAVPKSFTKQGKPVFWEFEDCPVDFELLYAYCARDVEVERELDKALRNLSKTEQKFWVLDQQLNKRGIKVDVDTLRKAKAFADIHKTKLKSNFNELTGLKSSRQTKKFKGWFNDRGHELKDVQKQTLLKTDFDVDVEAKKAADLAMELNKSSVQKFTKILESVNEYGFVRDILRYHGAHTGRWTGHGAQFHNLIKPKKGHDIDEIIESIQTCDYDTFEFLYGDVLSALASATRGMIIPPSDKHELMVGDYGQIEARGVAWLAGQDDVLKVFASGVGIYEAEATKIYGRTITKENYEERQVGKAAILSLGFGGGIAAFVRTGKMYGINLRKVFKPIWDRASDIERNKAEYSYKRYKANADEPCDMETGLVADIIKQRWRANNPKTVQFWADLEAGAIEAVRTGEPVAVGKVRWFMSGRFLYLKLPSKRCIAYPYPSVSVDKSGKKERAVLKYWAVDPKTKRFSQTSTYGGALAENVTQAMCRDILAESHPRLLAYGYTPYLHSHDENIVYVPKGFGSVEEFCELMRGPVAWAEGLPIAVEGWNGRRYGKK